MKRHFVKAGFCWCGEIRRFFEGLVLLLCVGWKMFVSKMCACVCVSVWLFIWGLLHARMFMRRCEKIYWTTSKVKPKKIFFLLYKPQWPSKNLKRRGKLLFRTPTVFSWSFFSFVLLYSLLFNSVFSYCDFFFLTRAMNYRKFIAQTRCDDNESMSGAELGNCA